MSAVAGFPIHRGVLAVGLRGPEPDAAALVPPPPAPALVLGLAGLTNHDNVGAAFRNAAAFGADAVLLDAASCDPLYRKSIRVSAGAALIQPFARLPAGADWLRARRHARPARAGAQPGGRRDPGRRRRCRRARCCSSARRGPGSTRRSLARARPVRIPMAAGFDSLNVATAAGIALHAIALGQGRLGRG